MPDTLFYILLIMFYQCFSCSLCDYVAETEADLQNHHRCHLQENTLRCSNCPKSFIDEQTLQGHLCSYDSSRNFTCKICGKTFKHCSSLSRHKRSHRKWSSRFRIIDNIWNSTAVMSVNKLKIGSSFFLFNFVSFALEP